MIYEALLTCVLPLSPFLPSALRNYCGTSAAGAVLLQSTLARPRSIYLPVVALLSYLTFVICFDP